METLEDMVRKQLGHLLLEVMQREYQILKLKEELQTLKDKDDGKHSA